MEKKESIPPGHFKCENCGRIFQKGWNDEEAKEEAVGNFGGLVGQDDAFFCDDCFNIFMKWLEQQQ